MDRASGEVSDDAVVPQRDVSDRRVVREHRDNHVAAAGIGDTGCLVRTQLEERTTLCGAAVEHGDIVSGLHEVCRHRRAHVAQSNESSLHVVISVGRSSGSLRGTMLTARVFLPGYEPLSPCYTCKRLERSGNVVTNAVTAAANAAFRI